MLMQNIKQDIRREKMYFIQSRFILCEASIYRFYLVS